MKIRYYHIFLLLCFVNMIMAFIQEKAVGVFVFFAVVFMILAGTGHNIETILKNKEGE